jgi:hypothetical protein
VTLLEESWSELFLLCAIQWCLPFDKPSLFAITEYEVVSAESVALLNHLTLMYNRYKRFNVNPAEFACMKAILLFKPGKCLSNTVRVYFWHMLYVLVLIILTLGFTDCSLAAKENPVRVYLSAWLL